MGFYSFCRGSRALPMLSFFHICRPCGERESSQTRNLGSYNKRFKPSLLSAFREQQGGKEKGKVCGGYSPPRPQLGPEGPRPHEWVHCMLDTTQPFIADAQNYRRSFRLASAARSYYARYSYPRER